MIRNKNAVYIYLALLLLLSNDVGHDPTGDFQGSLGRRALLERAHLIGVSRDRGGGGALEGPGGEAIEDHAAVGAEVGAGLGQQRAQRSSGDDAKNEI